MSRSISAHKIELSPNNKQRTYFKKACGTARFSYNWALSRWKEHYERGEKTNEALLRKELNSIKDKEFPWMREVTKVAPQQSIKDLGNAFNRFFKNQSRYPRFKKKGINDSFRADNGPSEKGKDAVKMKGKSIQLPCIGWVKVKENLRFSGQIKSVTISRQADKWFAALTVEVSELPHKRKNHGSVGVDLGIHALATLSNGTKIVGPKPLKALLSKLKRLSRQLSRKKIGSQNRDKAKAQLARLHARIRNIRQDALHKLTTMLVLNYSVIGIEDLNVKGMMSNRKLSRHIMDQSFYEFRRQLCYKADWYHSEVVIADRFFPSTQQCHVCYRINDKLTLSDRQWQCEGCGTVHDRDINSAINLEQNAVSTVSSTGSGLKKS